MENASDLTLVNADLDGKELLVVTVSVLLVRTWQLHALAREESVNPVSYTHLTLPTICSV